MKAWSWIVVFALLTGVAAGAVKESATETVYLGMCDASGAVALDEHSFAVANDEDNPIRVYDANRGGLPIATFDLSSFLRFAKKNPEVDLEGATWLGDRIYWISSHGLNKDAELRKNRDRFFATEWQQTPDGRKMVPVGKPYANLVSDLATDPRLQPFRLAEASKVAPKSFGGFNIEGLCQTPEGHLLIAFRNPIPRQQALLVPLLNPAEIVTGNRAKFGDPILLNLDGLGIRDITLWRGQYVIIAGPYGKGGDSALYVWPGGKAEPRKIKEVSFRGYNPEAIIAYPDGRDTLQVLSDDGGREFKGKECKSLKDPRQRQFRAFWVKVPGLEQVSGK